MEYQRDSARRNHAISRSHLLQPQWRRQDGAMLHRSDAAILTVESDASATAQTLVRVMLSKRYREQEASTPPGYPFAIDEQITLEQGSAGRLTVIRTPVDSVFRIARWWSNEDPGRPLAAVRRYMHSEPCLKFFGEGRPIWRIGDDPDHEVDYDVPTHRPFDAFEPEQVGLPACPEEAAQLMESLAVKLTRVWLRSNSRLES